MPLFVCIYVFQFLAGPLSKPDEIAIKEATRRRNNTTERGRRKKGANEGSRVHEFGSVEALGQVK